MATYNYFWNTKIHMDRQEEINTWLESLSENESKMFKEILKDKAEDDDYSSLMSM